MIQEIALSETKPSVSSCHTLLDSLQQICLMYGIEVDYSKKLFQTIGNIIELIEKDALTLIKETTEENAHLVSNLHSNLGCLYRMNGYPDLAREHMEKGLFLLERYNLLYTNDSIPQITNYAMFLAEQQSPEKGISVLQKLSKGIKEYNSDCCLDYAIVQETLGTIYLMTANLPQAKTHFKRAFKIYEKIWADEPEIFWNITAFTTGLAKDTKNLSRIKLWTKNIIF